jgi:hypothetical protein
MEQRIELRLHRLLPWVHQPADKEDNSHARVADQEDERMIGAEHNHLVGRSHCGSEHGDSCRSGSFRSFL